jgi:hypothetical protein
MFPFSIAFYAQKGCQRQVQTYKLRVQKKIVAKGKLICQTPTAISSQ